jgi:hypothetical protein
MSASANGERLLGNAGRGIIVVNRQFFLAAAAQNLKRLVRFLARTTSPQAQVTA